MNVSCVFLFDCDQHVVLQYFMRSEHFSIVRTHTDTKLFKARKKMIVFAHNRDLRKTAEKRGSKNV